MSEEENLEHSITVSAPINIALVKYWGKTNDDLIIPYNDSLSLTLDQDQVGTKTTISYSTDFDEDELLLNGTETKISCRLENLIT